MARSVVLRLSSCFRPYTKFYADNYFVDLGTVQKMWAVNRQYLTGTVQTNRKGWPRHLQPLVENSEKGATATCHIVYEEASEKAKILAVAWHDTKVVRYLSSEAQGVGVTMARRSYVEGQSRDRSAVDVTKLYQDNMGGVDRADSLRSAYGLDFKIKNKWPVVLYLKMIVETCVNNAYINWLTYQTYPTTNKPTGREFREQLARQLCGVQLDVPAPIAGHYPIRCRVDNAPCARNCKVCCGTQWVTHLGARKHAGPHRSPHCVQMLEVRRLLVHWGSPRVWRRPEDQGRLPAKLFRGVPHRPSVREHGLPVKADISALPDASVPAGQMGVIGQLIDSH